MVGRQEGHLAYKQSRTSIAQNFCFWKSREGLSLTWIAFQNNQLDKQKPAVGTAALVTELMAIRTAVTVWVKVSDSDAPTFSFPGKWPSDGDYCCCNLVVLSSVSSDVSSLIST